jgi:16S rRNA (uracil1498-N3)-methyltransferase
MRRALCDQLPASIGKVVELPEGEVRHLVSVLRLKPEDEIELLDGSGFRARAKLIYRGKTACAELLSAPETNPALRSKPVHLALAMLKGDAMEWVIEKAVELGVASITPVETEFSVVKIHKRGEDIFKERYQKIADQALKQCGRLERLVIHTPISFEDAVGPLHKSRLIWLDEVLAQSAPEETHLARILSKNSQANELYPVQILVGPEGGFSPAEKSRLLILTSSGNKAINRVHLGSLILRAETAALYGISLLVGHYDGR